MHVTISIAVACHPVLCIDDTHRLLRDADLALHEAWRDGRNGVRVRDTTPR
ncbi:MAG: GGDEF domain-containing protein [Rhodanobacter sp.]